MIPEEFTKDLEVSLASRDIQSGIALLDANRDDLPLLDPGSHNVGVLLGCVSKWIDMDFSLLSVIQHLVSEDKLAVSRRPALRFRDFAYLRFAEGIVGMHRGKIADALRHLTAVLNDARDLNDSRLMISGNYFVARCYRIKGLYDVAEEHAIEAQHLSEQQNGSLERQVAVIQILRAWLLFQKGDHAQAKQILEMAKTQLAHSSDYVSKGNAWSLHARMERRLSRSHLHLFNHAVREYHNGGEPGKKHPNLARVLANRALTHILDAHRIALRLKEHQEQRGAATAQIRSVEENDLIRKFEALHKRAENDLTDAEAICRPLQMNRALASCCLRRAFMYFDQCNGQDARLKVVEAYTLAKEEDDYITMGRAKVLECMIEDQDYLDGVGDTQDQSEKVYSCASEAVELAERTENRGLSARAYLAMGFALVDSKNDKQQATVYLKRTENIYNGGGFDFLWEHLQRLRSKVADQGSISAELVQWIQKPEKKSFDDLKDLLCTLVWEYLGQNIGRAAKNLGVDPETVKSHLVGAGRLPRGEASSTKKTIPAA